MRERWSYGPLFLAGVLISIVMALRAQVGGDQIHLLERGWALAHEGRWVPYGNPLTNGAGYEPGGLTSLLVGLPLFVWRDYRAPNFLILASHVLAWLLIDKVALRALRPRERFLLFVFYWLNMWRLWFSGFLWNPNLLYVFGALHLWTAWRLRERGAARWISLVHVAGIGLALQLHPSAVMLAFASAILLWRRDLKLDILGAAAGALVVALSLVPWAIAALQDPSILPRGSNPPGRGLLTLYPVARGLLYWTSYASWALPRRIVRFDFTGDLGAAADSVLTPPLWVATEVLGNLTLSLPIAANVWFWRRAWRRRRERRPRSSRSWLLRYVTATFVAMLVALAVNTNTFMLWQGLVVFHAAVLPVVLWLGAIARSGRASLVDRSARVAVSASLVLALASALGSPTYRQGGRHGVILVSPSDKPILAELHVLERCTVVDPGGPSN